MTDRQALEAALDLLPINDPDWRWDLPLVDIIAAARERLAQLEGMKLSVWWCTEHGASFQQEAIPGPPTWDCWAGPIEDEHCVPILLDAYKAAK